MKSTKMLAIHSGFSSEFAYKNMLYLQAFREAVIADFVSRQEPVAWCWDDDGYDMYTNDFDYMKSIQKYKPTVPLYTLQIGEK